MYAWDLRVTKQPATYHEIQHGVHRERCMSGEEGLPERHRADCIFAHFYLNLKIRYFLRLIFFFFFLPSLLNFTLWPLTLVVSDVAQRAVDSRKVRFADVEKVRTHASN